MKKTLFYCQHLLGVGHLTRSLALCEALAGSFEVDMIQGGPDIGLGLEHPRFRCLPIPPLLMREDDSSLYDPEGKLPAKEILELRRQALEKATESRRYDHFLVDLFPFGRRKFRHEILWLIERLKRDNPRIRIHSSLRDVMIERESDREAETVSFLKSHFDDVLVHSDPRFFRLEGSFGPAAEIAPLLRYTGFVAQDGVHAKTPPRKKRVLVSLGGGLVGGELALAAAEAAPEFASFEFHFALGPNVPEPVRTALSEKARESSNIKLVGFLRDFQRALQESELSVSLSGYNTVMDLLRTRTRGIVYPYGANREQMMRARRFEEAGLLAIAKTADLQAGRFAVLLRRELGRPYPDLTVDLDGAARTREILAEAA